MEFQSRLKTTYKTKGITTTSGYLPLRNSIPDYNAEIVGLLLSEGAIIIGKTNLSVLAMDMQADNPIFGKTNNPGIPPEPAVEAAVVVPRHWQQE